MYLYMYINIYMCVCDCVFIFQILFFFSSPIKKFFWILTGM